MQISIMLVVDNAAALATGTLDGHIYLIDNTQHLVGVDEVAGTPEKNVTHVIGTHDASGGQASEAILNWLSCGVSGPPSTLPRLFRHRNGEETFNARLAAAVQDAATPAALNKLFGKSGPFGQPHPVMLVQTLDGATVPLLGGVMTASGTAVHEASRDSINAFPPVVTNLYGPAVDDGVIYPALYGSPDPYTEGWYWSASVDTSKVGRHQYLVDVQIHQPEVNDDGRVVWMPRIFTMSAELEVVLQPQLNGFTGAYAGAVLPLPPCCGVQAVASDAEAACDSQTSCAGDML
ncbi:hypothetical protein [Insolitispirillum peregrinum]|uniref:Uncharacterized protein n=1 Tax=Insolitispirillum peregrinum TaxID=80876 RepID=A0A1N7MZA7_9PROT|nr:hypothetical protein [Insolitispirillum peregrinum]SIS91219.1 hypothetical protein SAMN05421779_104441 [Insolitispirillum peregrinum]